MRGCFLIITLFIVHCSSVYKSMYDFCNMMLKVFKISQKGKSL